MQNLIQDVPYICKLVFNLYKIPVFFFDKKGNLVYEVAPDFFHNPLYFSIESVLVDLFSGTDHLHFPIFKESSYLEKFFSISICSKNKFYGNIVVGPINNFKVTEETINGVFRDLDIKGNKEEIIDYFNHLPVLNNYGFINMSLVLYYMIYQQKLEIADVLQQNDQLEKEKINIRQPDIHITEQRQNKKVHMGVSVEKELLDQIRMGRKDELREQFHLIRKQGKIGVLSKTSYLRSQKNLAISIITLATRAAIDGGLFQETAYNLSDLFIQKLEELNESKEVDSFTERFLLEFAERVANSQKYKYSKPINMCRNYIFNHLYEDITLSHLADLTSLNPSYLSVLFKKEAGISLRQFINQTKIDEAKNLLNYSSLSLSEISSLLNFHDQSHFIKVFKKFVGVTPKQFKNGK